MATVSLGPFEQAACLPNVTYLLVSHWDSRPSLQIFTIGHRLHIEHLAATGEHSSFSNVRLRDWHLQYH